MVGECGWSAGEGLHPLAQSNVNGNEWSLSSACMLHAAMIHSIQLEMIRARSRATKERSANPQHKQKHTLVNTKS
jgi:hypothetical protein